MYGEEDCGFEEGGRGGDVVGYGFGAGAGYWGGVWGKGGEGGGHSELWGKADGAGCEFGILGLFWILKGGTISIKGCGTFLLLLVVKLDTGLGKLGVGFGIRPLWLDPSRCAQRKLYDICTVLRKRLFLKKLCFYADFDSQSKSPSRLENTVHMMPFYPPFCESLGMTGWP